MAATVRTPAPPPPLQVRSEGLEGLHAVAGTGGGGNRFPCDLPPKYPLIPWGRVAYKGATVL